MHILLEISCVFVQVFVNFVLTICYYVEREFEFVVLVVDGFLLALEVITDVNELL